MLQIHIRCIFQQIKKRWVIIIAALFVTCHKRAHLEQNNPVLFINGELNIQSQPLHNVLQFPNRL